MNNSPGLFHINKLGKLEDDQIGWWDKNYTKNALESSTSTEILVFYSSTVELIAIILVLVMKVM